MPVFKGAMICSGFRRGKWFSNALVRAFGVCPMKMTFLFLAALLSPGIASAQSQSSSTNGDAPAGSSPDATRSARAGSGLETAAVPTINAGDATGPDLSAATIAVARGATHRTLAQRFSDRISVADFGADPTGAADAAPAIYNAMLAAGSGGSIYLPRGTYRLDTIPWGTNIRNVGIMAQPGVKYIGNGARTGKGGLSNYWIFGHPLTNPYNATSGSQIECYGLPPAGAAAPGTNVTQCLSEELVGPHGTNTPGSARGATGLLHYIGTDNGDSIDNGNTSQAVNIVANIHNADNPVGAFGGIGLEVDMNVDVACRKTSTGRPGWTAAGVPPARCGANPGGADDAYQPHTFTGIFVDSGGAGGPYQASLGGLGVQVKRDAGAWNIGFSCLWAETCLETQAYNHAMTIHTTYGYHTPNDPFCAAGTNCLVQGGVFFDNAPYWKNTLFAGSLLADGSDAIVVSRFTDSSPVGRFLNFTNKANTATVFSVDVLGTVTQTAAVFNNVAGSYRATFYRTGGSSRWEQGVAGTPESGSEAGSEWYLNRYSDAGRLLDTPVAISRTNGVVKMVDGVQPGVGSFASLPACSGTLEGTQRVINDGPPGLGWAAVVNAGGRSAHYLVYCNGTNWTVQAK
jgi:hypothetical protein